jgi:hypothetical protein
MLLSGRVKMVRNRAPFDVFNSPWMLCTPGIDSNGLFPTRGKSPVMRDAARIVINDTRMEATQNKRRI